MPWCVRKCPYCDFNSHAFRDAIPADRYVECLLRDLEQELPLVWGRTVHSVFFGGGTPSLFQPQHFEHLLAGFRALLPLAPQAEITLEANPGTVEHGKFSEYRSCGINRVSLGVQSFDDVALAVLGRIHGRREALEAIGSLQAAGLENFNIDLMYALPGQDPAAAEKDLRTALDCRPAHLSHYQLTIEPNTAFHASPPPLPQEDEACCMQERCADLLAGAGYRQYEISAWALPDRACRHNLNYWHYGDYVGIGAGAHGKLTLAAEQVVRRRIRTRHPEAWMKAVEAGNSIADQQDLPDEERIFEFFLNQLRLREGVSLAEFEARTGLPRDRVQARVLQLLGKGLASEQGGRLLATDLGWRFVNDSQALFLP